MKNNPPVKNLGVLYIRNNNFCIRSSGFNQNGTTFFIRLFLGKHLIYILLLIGLFD